MVGECGDSMAAVQGLLKKHEALEAELAARAERVRDLSADGERLLQAGNLHSDALAHRIRALQVRHSTLLYSIFGPKKLNTLLVLASTLLILLSKIFKEMQYLSMLSKFHK